MSNQQIRSRGDKRIRTAVRGFADLCLATRPCRHKVCPTGIEPVTCCLEGSCSIQLSYGHFYMLRNPVIVGATGFEPATLCSQNRCATGLRYAPMTLPHGGFVRKANLRRRGRTLQIRIGLIVYCVWCIVTALTIHYTRYTKSSQHQESPCPHDSPHEDRSPSRPTPATT